MAICRRRRRRRTTISISLRIVSAEYADTRETGSTNARVPVPEPPTKRKTLVERAGETRSHLPGAPKSVMARSDSTTALVGSRGNPGTLNGYRNTSNASTSSSVSSVRQNSRQNGFRNIARPQQQLVQEPAPEEEDEADSGVMGKRKGTPIISLKPTAGDKITLRKIRTAGDLQQRYHSGDSRSQHSGSRSIYTTTSAGSGSWHDAQSRQSSLSLQQETASDQQSRNISLSTAFAELSLTPTHPPQRETSGRPRHRPSLERIKEEVSPSKIPKFSCTPSLRHAQSLQGLQTPSPLKHKGSLGNGGLRTPVATGARRQQYDVELPRFLTRETLTPVPAWDTKGRLEDMVSLDDSGEGGSQVTYGSQESLYGTLRAQFAAAADSKTVLEDSLATYKSRGAY